MSDISSFKPGLAGEHALQVTLGSEKRAAAFYRNQMTTYLTSEMKEFIAEQSMMFIASADAHGECDCSFRAGSPGFVKVIDHRHLLWPEYRGNGVVASGGNVRENPHLGMLFIDFVKNTVGLHVNGKASLCEDGAFPLLSRDMQLDVADQNAASNGKKLAFWFLLEVEEAYIHCAKHIPRFIPTDKSIDRGTDDSQKKGGDFFNVKAAKKGARVAGK